MLLRIISDRHMKPARKSRYFLQLAFICTGFNYITGGLIMPSQGTKFPPLEITRQPVITASPDVLDAVELRDGFKLPQSYRDFAQHFGYGLLCNLFIIYIPKEGGDDLIKRNATLTKVIREGVENDYFDYEPDGTPELALALIPFGISENGDILAWNPNESSGPDEYFIYLIGYKLGSIKRAAPNLYVFVESCLDNSIAKLIGAATQLIRPTFRPHQDPPSK